MSDSRDPNEPNPYAPSTVVPEYTGPRPFSIAELKERRAELTNLAANQTYQGNADLLRLIAADARDALHVLENLADVGGYVSRIIRDGAIVEELRIPDTPKNRELLKHAGCEIPVYGDVRLDEPVKGDPSKARAILDDVKNRMLEVTPKGMAAIRQRAAMYKSNADPNQPYLDWLEQQGCVRSDIAAEAAPATDAVCAALMEPANMPLSGDPIKVLMEARGANALLSQPVQVLSNRQIVQDFAVPGEIKSDGTLRFAIKDRSLAETEGLRAVVRRLAGIESERDGFQVAGFANGDRQLIIPVQTVEVLKARQEALPELEQQYERSQSPRKADRRSESHESGYIARLKQRSAYPNGERERF